MLIHAYTVSKQGKGGNDDEEDHSVLAAIVPSIVQKVLQQSGIRHQHKNSRKLLFSRFQLIDSYLVQQ